MHPADIDGNFDQEGQLNSKKIDAFEMMTLLSSKIIHRLFEAEGEKKLIQEFTMKLKLEKFEESLNTSVTQLFSGVCALQKREEPNLNVSQFYGVLSCLEVFPGCIGDFAGLIVSYIA